MRRCGRSLQPRNRHGPRPMPSLDIRSRALILLLLVAGLTSACAYNPARMPVIDPGGAKGSVETVFIATTRSPAEDPSLHYGPGRGDGLSFAEAGIWVPHNREPGSVNLPSATPDPAREFALTGFEDVADLPELASRIDAGLAGLALDERQVFLFVHGYNTPFSDGLYLNAQILNDFGIPGVAVHYAWPSAGRLPAYLYDRDSAQFARDGLADTLIMLADTQAVRINILAHSMGALLTMEALRELSLRGRGDVVERIDPLMLASPDIDFDVFRTQLAALDPPPEHLAIFASARDRALLVSGSLRGGGHPRIGSGAFREELNALGVAVIDLSTLSDGRGFANHVTFASSPTLMRLSSSGVLTDALMGESTHVRSTGIGALTDLAARIIYLPARALGER